MIGALINLLVYLLILGILWFAVDYAIKNLPVADPLARIVRIVLVVIFCLIIIGLLLSMIGVGGINMPRLVPG